MKREIRNTVLILAAGVLLGWFGRLLFESDHKCPEIKATFRVNEPKDIEFLLSQIETIRTSNDQGNPLDFKIADADKTFTGQGYTLKQSGPLTIPDHHGHAKVYLVSVRDDKAMIGYQWIFEHYSFGKNLETISSGVTEIDVVPKK